MILGTAGHIDHGKTTLVRALTGVDTDRLPEEKRRGITIDLGFAPLELEGVGTVGVVDVPGHEAFVRTMVAGATGIDLALLVVAADEGVMPQTREHLAILSLLGVRGGVVALTKSDLVEPDWLALVAEDLADVLAASPLAGAPVVPVSAPSGAGLPELRRALAEAALRVPRRASADLFRLPVDRAFTVRGTGTVVTGTVWSGRIARDASLRLLPGGTTVRVRGLQAHGREVGHVEAGDRAALALAGVDLDAVGRGAVLVQGSAWRPSRVLRADVALLADAPRALGPRTRVRLHLGTSEVSARLVVPSGALAPGDRTPARVVLDAGIVARAGDRFVLRAASPVATLGGGIVTDPQAPVRARPWPGGDASVPTRLGRILEEAGASGVELGDLPVRLGVAPREVEAVTRPLSPWRVGERLLSGATRRALLDEMVTVLERFHLENPLEPGAPAQWLRSRSRAPEPVSVAVLDALTRDGTVMVDAGTVRRPAFAPRLTGEQQRVADAMLAALAAAGQEPPTVDELATSLGSSAALLGTIARLLARDGRLVAVEAARYYRDATVAELLGRLRAGMAAESDYGPAELREILGFSRKFLIPFLEFCDRTGHTLRDGSGRRRLGGTSAGIPG
jgi:selenocysteine-specific elongation factor